MSQSEVSIGVSARADLPTQPQEAELSAGNALIPKLNYYSPEILQRELGSIFNHGYQFACLASELVSDRDFVCVDHAGASVVLQNFKGTIKAFQNVCTHRFNRIQTDDRGNRPLMCRYHAWTFDAEGFPSGLPKRSQFVSAGERNPNLCLPRYRVEVCGKFVFFAPESFEISLEVYLGNFYEELQRLSPHIGKEVLFASVSHAANWKLLVENVVECYHCAVAHPETFIAQGFGKRSLENVVFSGRHSSCHFPRSEGERDKLRSRMFSHLQNRGHSHDSFHHTFIFPNLFIASTEGLSFYVGHALPVSAEETVLRLRYFEPAVELTTNQRIRQDRINEEANSIGLRLVQEDKEILENVQKGMRISDMPGMIGDEETRVRAFMDAYLERMPE